MHNAMEAEERVSREMSALIEAISDDPNIDEPVTLGFVRDRIRESLAGLGESGAFHHFGDEETLCVEADALVEEYGEDVMAIDLATVRASDSLSAVIEAVVDQSEADTPPTLGSVREAMADGLVARLVGEGRIDADDEQALHAELDALIAYLGTDMLAESAMRFE